MEASNDNTPPETVGTGIPLASRWAVLRQEIRVLWLRLTGKLDRDE